MLQNLLYLLDRVIRSKSHKLRKENEYIWFCPFCNHYKPKLQINLISEKWHCWVCNAKGRSLFHLFQKLNSSKSEKITQTAKAISFKGGVIIGGRKYVLISQINATTKRPIINGLFFENILNIFSGRRLK